MENLWISTLCLAIQGFELFYFFGKGILILSSQNSVITLVPSLVDIRSKLDDLDFNIDFNILKMKKIQNTNLRSTAQTCHLFF